MRTSSTYTEGAGLQLIHTDKVYSGKTTDDRNNPFRFAKDFGYDALVNPFWILQNGQGDNKNFQKQTQFNVLISPKYQINKYLSVQDRFSYILNRNNERYSCLTMVRLPRE